MALELLLSRSVAGEVLIVKYTRFLANRGLLQAALATPPPFSHFWPNSISSSMSLCVRTDPAAHCKPYFRMWWSVKRTSFHWNIEKWPRPRYTQSIELWSWRVLPTPVGTSVVLLTVKAQSKICTWWDETSKVSRNCEHGDWDHILRAFWRSAHATNVLTSFSERSTYRGVERVGIGRKTCRWRWILWCMKKTTEGQWDNCFENVFWFHTWLRCVGL